MHSVGAPSWFKARFTTADDSVGHPPEQQPTLPGTDVAGLTWRRFSGATLLATLVDEAEAGTARAQPFRFLEKERSASVLGALGKSLAEVRGEVHERETRLSALWAGASAETKLLAYMHFGEEVVRCGQGLAGSATAAELEQLGKLGRLFDNLRIMAADRRGPDPERDALLEETGKSLAEQAPALIERAKLDRLLLAAAEPFLIGKSDKRSLLDLKLEAATLEGSALVISEAQRVRKAGALDVEQWARFGAAIEKLPNAASPGGRALLALAADENVAIAPDARKALHTALRRMGYYLPAEERLTASGVDRAIAENITEPDLAFRDLAARAGSPAGPITIGVMDGGFSPVHSALRDSLYVNEDELPDRGRDADGDGVRGNVHGHNFSGGVALDYVGYGGFETGMIAHGTHVAGIATRGTDRIRSFLVTRAAFPPELTAAIELSIAQGAKIINMSFSPWEANDVAAIRGCIERHPDVLFVKAAGNDGRELGIGALGAATDVGAKAYDNLLVVAASEEDGKRQSTSNFGAGFVAVAARGPQYSATTPSFSDDLFVWTGKTSQAAPLVTNVASKMLLLNPSLDPPAVKRILVATSAPDAAWNGFVEAAGTIDAARAMQVAAALHLIKSKKLDPAAAIARLGLDAATGAIVESFAR